MRRPNLFVVGAPKCGTTSLAAWLAAHEKVFVSTPKEPSFFCRPSLQIAGIHTLAEYEALFAAASGKHGVIAEASAMYAFDDGAVSRLLSYQPDAKIVMMLRSPIEMAVSWHSEMLRNLAENKRSFQRAWLAIPQRRGNREVPPKAADPLVLDYQRVCAIGSQLERIAEQVPSGNLHVILLDDIRRDPRATWLSLLEFLGLDDDGRLEFPARNVGYKPELMALHRLILRGGDFARRVLRTRKSTGIVTKTLRLFSRSPGRPVLAGDLAEEVASAFRGEIELIERITQRRLESWR